MRKTFLVLMLLISFVAVGYAEEYCVCPEYQYKGNTLISNIGNDIVGLVTIKKKKNNFEPFVCSKCHKPRKEPSEFETLEEKRQRLLGMQQYLKKKGDAVSMLEYEIRNIRPHIKELAKELNCCQCE